VTACARDCSGSALAYGTLPPGCVKTSLGSALYECGSHFNVRGIHEALHKEATVKEAIVNRAAEALGVDAERIKKT
jgi:hypothetical protein